MKTSIFILFIATFLGLPRVSYSQWNVQQIRFEFYGDTVELELEHSAVVSFNDALSPESVKAFYQAISRGRYQPIVQSLLSYKQQHQLDDWFYYQLIRRTAQEISPKAVNYQRYTLYKWFLLARSGYDATLSIGNDQLLFYVRSDENIYDIPFFKRDSKQYVCLNYHDYGKIDFDKTRLYEVDLPVPGAIKSFSYKVTQLPDFRPDTYSEKDLRFDYNHTTYHFKVKVNPLVQNIFANYPVVDFDSYFNIPLSSETYSSLIPLLKSYTAGMSEKEGVDYLMHFTRYAFLYENDQENFGKEKRLSPEQTLLYEHSDCDDRSGLFFYLVKELYNLPMIALLYPTHITIAVQFNKPVGHPVVYKGKKYSVCDPTPQVDDPAMGELSSSIRRNAFQVVYEYNPDK